MYLIYVYIFIYLCILCTLLLDDLIPRMIALLKRMLKQGADMWKIIRQCKKAMDKHSHSFRKFASSFENIIERIIQELD